MNVPSLQDPAAFEPPLRPKPRWPIAFLAGALGFALATAFWQTQPREASSEKQLQAMERRVASLERQQWQAEVRQRLLTEFAFSVRGRQLTVTPLTPYNSLEVFKPFVVNGSRRVRVLERHGERNYKFRHVQNGGFDVEWSVYDGMLGRDGGSDSRSGVIRFRGSDVNRQGAE